MQYKKMRSLAGSFVKEEEPESADKSLVLYPFSLFYLCSKETYYASEQANWVKALKETLGYANLYDFYDLHVSLAAH